MSDIPKYQDWQPEPLDQDLAVDIQPMGNFEEGNLFRCIISRFVRPRTAGEDEYLVPIITVNAWGSNGEEAQYEAYKRACYFVHYKVLPLPWRFTLPIDNQQPREAFHVVEEDEVFP